MTTNFSRVIVGYGSESGTAERLARKLCEQPVFHSVKLELVTLNQLSIDKLTSDDLLLVITSTFGDGEPPGNADEFLVQLLAVPFLAPFQFAIFSLGDVAYTNFCKFGQQLDTQFSAKGATRIINRVDADLDYHDFFSQWTDTVSAFIFGDDKIGSTLDLQVKPYSQAKPHQAKVVKVCRLNTSSAGVYQIDLDIEGSGMKYRAGDLLYVLPKAQSELVKQLAAWFDDEQAIKLLQGKELRLLNKALLRTLANKTKNAALKDKLKIRNKTALADYLYQRDLLDILQDCGEPGHISLLELIDILPQQVPRAYSIASCGQLTPDKVSLCIRDITYQYNERMHFGTVSHRLSQCVAGDKVSVFSRSNSAFHLADSADTPLIMIAAGTGIAPFIGFLQQREQQAKIAFEALLIFGERYNKQDFLYQDKLENWLKTGVLTQLFTTFSRDQAQKYYVQHAIVEQGEKIWSLLQANASLYVCGSKDNLAKPIDEALIVVAQQYGNVSEEVAQQYVLQLSDAGRYRRDLY